MKVQDRQKAGEQSVAAGAAQASRVGASEHAKAVEESERNRISVIGPNILVTGNIGASNDLHIEGRVIGDVRCATLFLAEGSVVEGRISADRVKVSGTVTGGLETNDLAVEASGRLIGDITYQRLRVANGGVVEGTLFNRASGK